ncbi:hypothetical protein Esti_006219 [Eimeria stiedai]
MLANILDQVIKTYGKEFLGDWDPINNFRIDSLTDPEIHLTNIPFPQQLFELAEIPFAVDYSNIAKVRAKFSWQTFFGSPGAYPFAIDADGLEIRIRLLYPSEWSSEFWRDKILKAKLKRAAAWEKFASLLGSAQGDRSSMAQTIEPRIVNSLSIRVRNIHVHIVDDNLGVTPWAFECHVDEFCIDSPKRGDPRISEMEATGLEQCLLMGLWMRFVGMHFWYREFSRPQLEGKAGVSVNINKARELRRRLRRNPGDEEAQRLLSKLLQKDAYTAAADAAADVAASEAAASSASTASAQPDAHRHARATQLHSDLRLLHQRASDAGVEVDAGTLTTMLSKEIQETLRIEDQSVSHSLASRDPQQRAASPPPTGVLTPSRAETILRTNRIATSSRLPEGRLTAASSMQHLAPQGPAAAAATAAAAAEAAAGAAALAKDAAAKAVSNKEEERESSMTSDSSSEEADLLTGVRAARAFKVVPSQIKDLLDDNTHAFRITPKNGIEMQILFKKWELRALGSSLAVNKQSWKSVELSFLHHDPTLYSPQPGPAVSSKQQQEQKDRREALSVPPPVFDGSMEHKPLQLTFTSAALASLFNFVKLIDTWFVFMKGAGRPIRLIAREQECATYCFVACGLLMSCQAELREVVDRYIADFEEACPLYLILKLRQMAEDSLTWRDGVSAAVLQKQIFGRFSETCCRPEGLGSLQWATGETAETRIDGVWGANGDPTDKERLLLEDIAYTVDEASGDERGGFGGKRWFYIDGLLSVVAPNLCFRLLPLIQPGMHIACPTHLQHQEQSRQSIRRHGTLTLLEHLENQQSISLDASRPQAPPFPLTTLMFRVCTDFKFRQEKRNDAFKCQDIFVDSLFVEKGFAALRAQPCSDSVSFRAPHDPEIQTALPDLIISARSMGRMGCTTCVYLPADPPSRLGWGIGPARPPLRGHALDAPSAPTGSPTEYTEYDMIGKDELFGSPPVSDRSLPQWQVATSPAIHVESPQESGDGEPKGQSPAQQLLPQRIRPSQVYSNLHAFFHRARNLAEIVKKTTKKNSTEPPASMKRRGSIGADRNRTIFISMSSKLLWDEELGGPIEKKKTWVNIPEVSICAPELIPLAEALPMSFVTWDLFKQKDCLLPASTEDAMGLALGYCQHVDLSLRLSVQKATLIYRLSSLDYSRVLSHVKRDALAEARELQQQAAAEVAAAQAAAQATAARTWRFGGLSWEGRAALSDSGSLSSSSSSSSLSAFKGRWRQMGWAERAAAAAAAGKPLAFLGERGWDGRREFEANRRLVFRNSSSSQSLPDFSSDPLTFSDSFILSSYPSEGGRQASDAESAKSQPQPDFPGDGLAEDSDDNTFLEDSAGRFRSGSDPEELFPDLFCEPVEEHGFSSACKGLKATVTALRLKHTVAKRKLAVTSDELSLTIEAAKAAVLAQPDNSNEVPSATEDCQVALISNVNIGLVKARQNKVKVAVGRVDLGVCTQLVSLAAFKNFLMPNTFPYSDSLRDTPTLKLKLAQIGTLQRKTLPSRLVRTASREHAHPQQVPAAFAKEAYGSDVSSDLAGDAKEGAATSVATARQSEEDNEVTLRRPREGDVRSAFQSKLPEAFLPMPTSGPWAVCDGTRYEWFFHDEELAQKFSSSISPLKFTGPGQEDKESFQRWRVAKNPNLQRKDVVQVPEATGGAETDMVGNGAAGATTAVASEPRQPPLQVFAKVGCLSVGLYTQQQHLAVLLRVYEARVQLRKKQKDIRLKANVGELFVEHLKVRGAQRRSIVLCKKVVHVGGQCRRFPKLSTAATSATSPTPPTRARNPHPAALLRSEVSRWSGSSRHTTSSSPSPCGRPESSGSFACTAERDAGFPPFDLQKGNEENGKKDKFDAPPKGMGSAFTTQIVPNDGKPSLREQMLQYQWRRDHQVELERKLHFAKDEEQGFSNSLLMRKEELLGAGFAGTDDKESVALNRNEQQKPVENAEASEPARDKLATQPESLSADKIKGPLRLSMHPLLQSKHRSLLMRGLPHPPDVGFRSAEKARISEYLANSRSRFTQSRQQHPHWGLPWHGRTGAAHDSDSSFLQLACDSDSSVDDTGQLGATDMWYPDVVGGWTLRGDTDRESDAGATPDQHPGHDCCFGIPEAPLNLLLFEDTNGKRLTGVGGKRKVLGIGDLKLPLKGSKNKKRDQLCLSFHLEPDSKTTEAQLSLQSLHAFPTANLLCCLTDAALFLKSQWDEESIRSRCLLACLLSDARFQKTADLAGLSLQSATGKEAKRPTKRQVTSNRRLRQQSPAFNKVGSGGSEGGSDTSSSSTSSAVRRKLSRGKTELRKQARTTFSRWGPPEGFSDGDSSLPTGVAFGDASRRASRSPSGSKRRRKIFVPASSREKTRSSGASAARGQRAGVGTSRSLKGTPYSRGDVSSENTKDGSSIQPLSAEGSSDAVRLGKECIESSAADAKQTAKQEESHVRSVRVSVELVLEDVTCNLLTDDAADTEGLNETELTSSLSRDSAVVEATPEFGSPSDPGTLTARSPFLTQQQVEKRASLGDRRRYAQQDFPKSSSDFCRDAVSTASTSSTINGSGDDAGLGFPPFPVLFSPDLCVPSHTPGMAEGMSLHSSLRRAVIADAAALGVRLEAALRLSYTSVPTSSSSGKKREELTDTLRVGLWRLEATFVKNCTWALASVVLFDLNLRAECLRLLPLKKRRAALGTAKSGGRPPDAPRTLDDNDASEKRLLPLHAVEEHDSGDDDDGTRALQHTLWLAERGGAHPPAAVTLSRGRQGLPYLRGWDERLGSNVWQEGYESADAPADALGYKKRTKIDDGGVDEGTEGEDRHKRENARTGSCSDARAFKVHPAGRAPRRIPSSGSSSFLRRVFGSRAPSTSHGYGVGASPSNADQLLRAHYFKRLSPGVARIRVRSVSGEADQMTHIGGGPEANSTDAATHARQEQQCLAGSAAVASPIRRRASSMGWPRSLLKSRRSLSVLNGTEDEKPAHSPLEGQETQRADTNKSDVATGSGDMSSASPQEGEGRGRQRLAGSVGRPIPSRRGLQTLSALPSVGDAGRLKSAAEQWQRQEHASDLKARTATGSAAARRENRSSNTGAVQRKEAEEDKELITCRAIDLEIKRVAVWSAVYLQENKAAANPCRAAAASMAADLSEGLVGAASSPVASTAAATAALPASAEARNSEVATAANKVHRSLSHLLKNASPRIASPVGAEGRAAKHLAAGGTSSPTRETARKPEARRQATTPRPEKQSRVRRAAQEWQHLTNLLDEVWAEDWLSVSIPSPPPFGSYFRQQEGRVLLLPVLLRASNRNERHLLQQRLQEAKQLVDSATPPRKKRHSSRDKHDGPAVAEPGVVTTLRGMNAAGGLTAAAVVAGFPLNTSEEKKTSAAAQRLKGAANLPPHLSVMYRLIDETGPSPSNQQQPSDYTCSDANLSKTKVVCRADIFSSFCACTPFVVDGYTRMFGKEGEMTAVLSRLSMGLRAVRLGMQKQQQTAAEATKAAAVCLPGLASSYDAAAAVPRSSLNEGSERDGASAEQRQEFPFDARAFSMGMKQVRGQASGDVEASKKTALLVGRRLWGTLPGSLLQLGFGLRAALARLTHDAFVSLYIHSLQLTLPSPCQLLSLPAIPATRRLLPVTALRSTLTSDPFYFVCCLATAPSSPCIALDLVLTLKGIRRDQHFLGQHQHQKWTAKTAATFGRLGSTTWPRQLDGDGRRPRRSSMPTLHFQHGRLSSPTAGGVVGATPAAAAVLDGMPFGKTHQERTRGSIEVTFPLLRLELLKRPRLLDDTAPSALDVAQAVAPRIALSPFALPTRQDGAAASGGRVSGNEADQIRLKQSDCVLEVLLKDLEVTFVSEKQPQGMFLQKQPLRYAWTGRLGGDSELDLSRIGGLEGFAGGQSAGLDPEAVSLIEPFRMIASLRDCIVRGEDGSILLQNASCIPKLFSGAFTSGTAALSAIGGATSQGPYSAAGISGQHAAGGATPSGAQGSNQEGSGFARRPQQKARLSVQQALAFEVPLQDPLLQSLVWVSDNMVFVSGEAAYLRIQIKALLAAAACSWGLNLFGALQQMKHFRLHFPAISFGCCFSTASCLAPLNVKAEQLLRIWHLQSRGPPASVRDHQQQPEDAEDHALRRSLLLQQRSLGILCLLYPSLPPPAMSPKEWLGYLPLQLPEVAPPISVQLVLKAIEAEAATREAPTSTNGTDEVAAHTQPWRLQTADMFQHHSDLRDSLQLVRPGRMRTNYGRSSWQVGDHPQRAASAELMAGGPPYGKSSPVGESGGMTRVSLPTLQEQSCASVNDPQSDSSPDGTQRFSGVKEPEGSAAKVKKPHSAWSWLQDCLFCRRRRKLPELVSRQGSAPQVGPATPKGRVAGFLRSLGSSLSAASSASAAPVDRRMSPPNLDAPHPAMSTAGRGERKRFSTIYSRPSGLEELPWQRQPSPLAATSTVQSSPKAPRIPSASEAESLAARLQKVVELSLRGVEVWLVVGAADGENALHGRMEGDQTDALAVAGINSYKNRRKGLKSLAARAASKAAEKSQTEQSRRRRLEGQPLSKSVMQVLLTAANRKGLCCVEEESSEDRRNQQIVVGLLVACSVRLLQKGPEVNVCGDISELSAMVGSPVRCNDFVLPKSHPMVSPSPGGRSAAQQHIVQLTYPDSPQQQEQPGGATSRSMEPAFIMSLAPTPEPASSEKQHDFHQDESVVKLFNFPDVLEGYGGALLLPNLQQRTDCILSLAPSTVTVSGTPGGKAKICVTIVDPQIHFSFEMFQGIVSLETQVRLEQLQVSKAAAAALAALKASVAAAAAAAEADAVALVQQRVAYEQDVPPLLSGRRLAPFAKEIPPPSPSDVWASVEKLRAQGVVSAVQEGGGGFLAGGQQRTFIGEGGGGTAGGGVGVTAATAPGTTAAMRVTNYSVSMGDVSMEGSLLLFLRNYVFTLKDSAAPAGYSKQRPLFGWTGNHGGGDGGPQRPVVNAIDLLRLHQQRRGGAIGRVIEELHAMSSKSVEPPQDEASPASSSASSISSVSPPELMTQAEVRSQSWGPGDEAAQQKQAEPQQTVGVQRQSSQQLIPLLAPPSLSRSSRETRPVGDVGDEEAVASEELLLLANLMAAGCHSAARTTNRGKDTQGVNGLPLSQQHARQQQQDGRESESTRRYEFEVGETPLMAAAADEGAPVTIALLQGVGEADFTDPYCRVIGLFLSLLSFKIPGETELEIKGEVVQGAFEFHDAHGSLLKISLLALEGQIFIHPELWSADSVKEFGGRLEAMASGYDPMTNSQEELLHPVSASVEIQRQYVDGQASHWSLVNIRSAMDGVSVDITSGLLQLVYHIVRTSHEILQGAEGSLGRLTSLRVYNDIHSDILVMHRRRSRDEPTGWDYSRMQPEEWILAPTTALYFAVRKHLAAVEAPPEKRRPWRRGKGAHQKLDEAQPTLRLDSYEEVKRVVEGILQLGTKKVDNAWLRAYEETLLFAPTRKAQAPLEMLVDDMPVLHGGGNLSVRYGWEGLLQLLRREPGWCCMGRLHADYSNCRAYFLQNAGFKVLVEPVVDRRNGTWSLTVGSCVQLANACSMTLRVYVGRTKRNWGGRAISCFAARVTGETRGSAVAEEYIDILPGCRRSVPLSWFGNGSVPSLTALLHTEDGGEKVASDTTIESSPEIPPVAFAALYKLTNKTGYAQPRRLDIPPFTLRLRGSLMLYGRVDTTDVPTSQASRIAQRYVIKLEPMLSIRNTLPFPITVAVYLRHTVETQQAHELGASAGGGAAATGAAGSIAAPPRDGTALAASSTEAGLSGRHAFGNAQAGLLAELESRKRQKQEAQQSKSRGTAAKLVANSYVEATIPSHQSWGLPVGEQRLWLVLRVHGAPLEQFNTQLGAFNPSDGRPLGPVELQLLASAALRGPRLAGTTWLLQQDFSEGTVTGPPAVDAKVPAGNNFGGPTLRQRKQQLREPRQPETVYESQRFVVLLPTQDTVTVSKVLQLKDGRGESLLPPGALRLARAEAQNQRRGRKGSSVYSEMQLAADVSRRQITVFAPYFFENLTDATLWVNGALVPSRCRLYTTEEDMRAASIKAYKVDLLADRVLQSPLSRKHDLSGISTARPPLILKLTAMRKQRGIRFAWGARANSAAREEPRQSQEGIVVGSGDSVISSLNAGAGVERPMLANLGSDVARDAPQGDSPSFKPTPSFTDSFVDDDVVGQRPHDKRLRFSPKRPANAFAAARGNRSETFSAIGENEEDALFPSRRGKSFRVTVQRRVQKLGGARRARKLRKSYEAQGFDSSGADSGEKEGTLTYETRDQSIPPRAGSGAVAPNSVSQVEPAPKGNSSNSNGNSTPPPTLVLGLCTRYGDAPYSTTKIVSVIPRYMFISRLPFSVMVREVRSRSRVLGGAMSARPKSLPCELSLLPGETKAFHGVEPRVLLAHVAKSLVSCPFSLCPAHVPSFFQVEMTPRGLGSQVYLPEHCTIIQVSIVSGLFGDVPALPYTYNGSFIVLSLPEYPQFAILNLTSYFLAHAPAERNRRNQQNHLRDDAFAIPIASGTQARSMNKKNREDSYGSLRLIPPWGSVPFIPPYHKNLENTRVRLRVLDVDHCPWSVHSLASVDEELQTIEFVPRQGGGGVGGGVATNNTTSLLLKSPRSADGNTTARKVPLLQRLPTKTGTGTAGAAAAAGVSTNSSSNHQQQPKAYQGALGTLGGAPSEGGYPGLDEDVFATQEGDSRLGRPQTPRAGQGPGGSSKEKQPATLYVFSLVAASGSRILIVAESRDVAAKLRAGGSAFDMVREELVGSSMHAAGAVGAAAAAAAAAAGLNESVGTSGEGRASGASDTFAYASVKPKEAGSSSGDAHARETSLAREVTQRKTGIRKSCQKRPPPWLALSFEFRLPRLTVTWIHQSEVVLALHLTGLSLSGAVSPRQLDAFLEAVPLEHVLQISGGGAAGASSQRAALVDSAAGGGSPAAATQTASVDEAENISRSNSPVQDSTASPAVEELDEDDALALHGGLQQQQQQQPLEDYAMLVMTRSAVSLSTRISMLHVDHFVKGDIPVILKNTASKYGKESEEFLEVAVVRSLVDPRQAPTYDLLEVRISPFSANIELLVIEQLIRIYEKEIEMLYKFAVAAPQKPPALQTALKCSDAAEALRQLAVIDLLEANRKEAALAGETNAGANAAAGSSRGGATAPEAAAGGPAHASAAAFLKHPLAYDLSHPGSRSMVKAQISMDRSRRASSLTGGFHYPLAEEAAGGADARGTEQWLEALLREPAAIQFYASPRVFINPPSSHVLVLPNPRWMELHRASPVYIKNLIISSLSLTVSIRTSEHRISRQVLHIVDALPLDTPYMAIQIARERRKFTVCSWHELLHSLRNSYLRQFIRQSLPSAWISNPCAFVVGFLRGTVALFRQTIKGAKTSQNSFEGIMTGFRVGFILFIIYTMGGVMQSLSHVLNILHKLMRGSRPRPYGVLDAFWKGLNGMLLDTFWRPWVALVAEPAASATRGDSWWKTTAILLACCVRCLISPLFGLSNFFASVAEGFANTLIGDFEQFTRVQERADLDKKHKHLTGGEGGAADVLGGSGGTRHGRLRSGDAGSGFGHGDAAGAVGGGAAGLGSRFRRGKWKAAGELKHGGLKAVGRSKAADAASANSAPANDAAAGSGNRLKPPGSSFSNAFRRASSKQVTFAL